MAEKTMVEALKEMNLSKTSREDLPYLELKEMKELNVFQKIMLLRNDDLLKGIKKTGFNKFQGFKYFELVDFLPTVTQLEVIYGLTSLFSIDEQLAKLEVINVVTGDKVVFTSTIAEANVKGMLDIQQLGSKHTYLKRYLYYNYLNLTENDGVDGLNQDSAKSEVSTPTQHNQILELLDHEDAKIEHTLKSYKVEKLMDLTHDQAVEIITKLEAWKKKRQ